MARYRPLGNPLDAWLRTLRSMRGRGLAEDRGQAALRHAIELALFRVPARQREIVRRYDLRGEPAAKVQVALGISARQFYRDRRAALNELRTLLPSLLTPRSPVAASLSAPRRLMGEQSDAMLSSRANARSLAQSGSEECFAVLRRLACNSTDPGVRADLLLELAEAALDFDDDATAHDAVDSVVGALNDRRAEVPGLDEYLVARLTRAKARLTKSYPDAIVKLTEALAWLRRSLAAAPEATDARAALLATLGDMAILDFEAGNFTSARLASTEAVRFIESFSLWTGPRALEVVAMDATIDACLSGYTGSAISTVSSLLRRAVDSAWSATASRLGADLIGLYGVSGECGVALRWYERAWPTALKTARPRDRWSMMVEAAGSCIAGGAPRKALAILSHAHGAGRRRPRRDVPTWHAFVASSLLQLGENAKALEEAQASLRGYEEQCVGRGMSDAHRLIAKSYARLGDMAAAREHIREAGRLTERYGTAEGLLCTLNAQAEILPSTRVKADAIELEQLLRSRAQV
jgi:tetratricopeptide (TPR) repeat protein